MHNTSFDASEKAMAAALLAAKEAVEKANVATEKRFDNVTDLLAQQTTQLAILLPRAEADARMGALDARVTDIKSTVDKGFTGVDTRGAVTTQFQGYIPWVISFVSMAFVVIAFVLNHH